MSFANEFDARLDRIRAERGIEAPKPKDQAPEPVHRAPPPAPEIRESGRDVQFLTLIALALFFVPLGVFAAIVTLDIDLNDIELKMPTFDALTQTAEESAERPERNIVERLIFGKAPPFLYTYLPPAPEGWIKVTPADTLDDVQAAIAGIAARYPGGEAALREHPVFQSTARFLDLANDPRVTFPR